MLAKMIDKIVSLKETKIFEIGGQTYADAPPWWLRSSSPS